MSRVPVLIRTLVLLAIAIVVVVVVVARLLVLRLGCRVLFYWRACTRHHL